MSIPTQAPAYQQFVLERRAAQGVTSTAAGGAPGGAAASGTATEVASKDDEAAEAAVTVPVPRFKGRSGGRQPFNNNRRFGDLDTNSFDAVTMDTPLPTTNPGFKMLLRMGWRAGTGLGSRRQGRVDPISVSTTYHKLGLVRKQPSLHFTRHVGLIY
jgi:hypothetical protein